MAWWSRASWAGLLAALIVAGCAPAAGGGASPPSGEAPKAPTGPRTLNVAVQVEPLYISSRALRSSSNSQGMTVAVFNAGLAYQDENKIYHEQLAEALPKLNTDTWKVAPDGTMETTWRLKPNLTYHDGTAVSTQDWVLSYKIFSDVNLGNANTVPVRYISEMTTPDDRTLVVRWKQPYADADGLLATQLPPLPRHLLEGPYATDNGEQLAARPFWTREFVGAGPYRVTKWEPGAFLEAEAFAQYVGGRPKIDKINFRFIPDPSVVISNFLSGAIDVGFDNIFRLQQATTLKGQWGPNDGTVLKNLGQTRRTDVQRRPEHQKPSGLLALLPVRRALAYALDRETLNQGLLDGESQPMNSLAVPADPFFAEVERVAMRYPFDPRLAEQQMRDAGFAKGPDGFYTSPSFGKFNIELWALDGTQNVQELQILGDLWKLQGFDLTLNVVPAAQVQNNEVRSTFPGLSSTSAGNIDSFTAAMTGGPNNRWQGSNFGGWPSSKEYEDLIIKWDTTLDRPARYQAAAQASKILTEDVATIPLLYNPQVIAFRNTLSGVRAPLTAYNIAEWTLK